LTRSGASQERAVSKYLAMHEPSADLHPQPTPTVPTRISKEDINLLPLAGWEGPVVLVRSNDDLDPALERLAQTDLLGFDTETRPAFRKGQSFPPSLLQLATDNEVFLFQLQRVGLPGALLNLLSDPGIVKAGVGLDFDLKTLQELRPFQPRGFTDLARIARRKGIRNNGLRGLAAAVCGIRISKSSRTTNWANPALTPQQIRYAATDAWIGRELYLHLDRLPDQHHS
jgi:ribonuclease D